MKLNNSKSRWQLLSVLSVMLLTLFAVGCEGTGADGDEDGDTQLINCITHADCPAQYSCLVSKGVCGTDPNATNCYDASECTSGYCCFIASDSADGMGKCVPDDGSVTCGGSDGDNADGDNGIPSSCKENSDCNDPAYVCCDNKCEERNRYCDNVRDCLNGQRCDDGVCTGDPVCGIDGDVDPDPDPDNTVDGDVDPDPDPDPDTAGCERSSDCPQGTICGPGGVCGPRCDAPGQSCPNPQSCNPNNGMCECCENDCEAGRCCNRSQGFWYCGQCCTPPCQAGMACQAGTCVALTCPTCGTGETCKESDPCRMCEGSTTDGDTDGTKEACLPANSACQEGIDNCCSGTCMMGTCL